MRVVIADDEVLLREGLDRLLTEAGFDVVGKAATPDELRRRVELTRPDVAITDIKMPPSFRLEGIDCAHEIRAKHPGTGGRISMTRSAGSRPTKKRAPTCCSRRVSRVSTPYALCAQPCANR